MRVRDDVIDSFEYVSQDLEQLAVMAYVQTKDCLWSNCNDRTARWTTNQRAHCDTQWVEWKEMTQITYISRRHVRC